MKQRAQINIIHSNKQLHYLIELHDSGITEVSHSNYSYRYLTEGYKDGIEYGVTSNGQKIPYLNKVVQFIRNMNLVSNYDNREIHNTIRNINTWMINDNTATNYYIPNYLSQRQVTLYIPRYSMESFYDDEFGEDHELSLSGLKYILTAHTFIAGVRVILGSYIFDLSSARAVSNKTHYKMDDYQMCVDFNIVDPVQLTYDDKWKGFRTHSCGEPDGFNNTGSVIEFCLEPVILSDEGSYYIRSSEFVGGMVSMPFEVKKDDFMNAQLTLDGDACLSLEFNDVYNGDVALYLAETYGMWELDEDGNRVIDEDGEPIPRADTEIFELIIRDKENVYAQYTALIPNVHMTNYYIFYKQLIQEPWSWYKDGLIMQGSVEIYDIPTEEFESICEDYPDDEDRIEAIRSMYISVVDLISNELPLTQERYKLLVPTRFPEGKIDFAQVDMMNYNVSVVNKIHKEVISINRPEDYKANIIKPVFIRTNPLGDITVHPEVTENIGINLNQYKSKVDLFYLRIEGVDFIEIGRTATDVVFAIDGHLLPNEVNKGIAYILDQDHTLVTTTKYTYEQ